MHGRALAERERELAICTPQRHAEGCVSPDCEVMALHERACMQEWSAMLRLFQSALLGAFVAGYGKWKAVSSVRAGWRIWMAVCVGVRGWDF